MERIGKFFWKRDYPKSLTLTNEKEMLDKIFPQEKDFEVVKKTSERYGLVREILVSLQSERL